MARMSTPTPRTARALARDQITRAILDHGRAQLAEVGPAALSLRGVARDLGMASSAVYRYVASRDDLLTMLLVEAYDELGAAVEDADDRVPRRSDLDRRWRAMCTATRSWALAHPHDYALLYGSPVPGYAAPQATIDPATRVTRRLMALLVDAQAAGVRPGGDPPAVSRALRRAIGGLRDFSRGPVDDALLLRGVAAWTTIFGTLSFELFGHFVGAVEDSDRYFDHVVRLLAADLGLDRAEPSTHPSRSE